MKDITVGEMIEMQKQLRQRYTDWSALTPETARDSLLWAYGEMAEVGDILKKKGHRAVMENAAVREDFVEEMCDVMMYLSDLMICFGISPEEIRESYVRKFQRNVDRW